MARHKGSAGDAQKKLLEAAGRGFRVGGYGGIGVDGLAKEAGLTSGAFYAHFGSKADAFQLAVQHGLESLRQGIESFQSQHGADWLLAFIDFYMEEHMALPLCEACALPTLTADVARANEETRAVYNEKLGRVATQIARGLYGNEREARAWKLLAVLSGAAAMARAVTDPALRAPIVASAKALAKSI